MKLNLNLVGIISQFKLVQIEGKKPFLDIHIDVVRKTASGKDNTQWVRAKVWQDLALKTAPLLCKGSMVAISGRPEVNAYSRRDGSPGAELVVHADEIEILSGEETTEDEAAA
jgi:single-stranded DNA-binding protein